MVYDGVNHNLKLLIQHRARALALTDVDGDGVLDIVAGRDDGIIDVFDGKTFSVKKSVVASSSAINAVRVADVDGDGAAEWITAGGGVLSMVSSDGLTQEWKSGTFDSGLGLNNHLVVRDLDGDGIAEILAGSNLVVTQFH